MFRINQILIGINTMQELIILMYVSGKKATEVPSELWEIAGTTGVTVMNFSKNILSQWPEE